MLDSISGLSDKEIIRIIEENLFEQIRYYGKSPGTRLIENKNIIKLLTDIPLPFFNCVLYYNYDPGTLKEVIKDFIAYGRSKNTSLLWLKGPSSVPQDIGSVLSGEGFKYDDHMKGMAVDISDINSNQKHIPGFKIEVVNKGKQLSEWVHACLKGFDENGKNYQSIYEFEESLGLGSDRPWVRFTGIAGGEAVATSGVFMGSKVAGLDNVTTISKWRKKGIGALMVSHALQFARSWGYGVGVLQASDMGLNLYRYLGFREFVESKEYIWKNNRKKK
jgi:GNAT superfamily N-acetyltransferase